MFGLEPTHLLIVAIVVVLVFGPKRLPELARGLGQGMRDFKKALNQPDDEPKQDETTPTHPGA
jgi:sec-independent protein translocase protein TatA